MPNSSCSSSKPTLLKGPEWGECKSWGHVHAGRFDDGTSVLIHCIDSASRIGYGLLPGAGVDLTSFYEAGRDAFQEDNQSPYGEELKAYNALHLEGMSKLQAWDAKGLAYRMYIPVGSQDPSDAAGYIWSHLNSAGILSALTQASGTPASTEGEGGPSG